MLPVTDETLMTIREFVSQKLGGAEKVRIFLRTPHPDLGNCAPQDILRRRDHYEVMKLCALLVSVEDSVTPRAN